MKVRWGIVARMLSFGIGGFGLLLATMLSMGCATSPRVVALKPPAELLEPVAEPVLAESPKNLDLARFADELLAALREANRRLRAAQDL